MKNSMITVNTNTGDLERFTLGTAKYDLFYVAEEEDPQSLFSMPKHIQLETTNNQFVTVNAKNEALVVAENVLKSANYTSEDFTFWLDTAAYERNGEVLVAPYYYVTKGVSADEEAGVEAHRLYMYNATDSAENATVDKEQYKAYGATRVIFREALRYGADSLIVAGDTLTLDGKKQPQSLNRRKAWQTSVSISCKLKTKLPVFTTSVAVEGKEDINIQNDAIYTSKLEGRIEGLAEGEAKGKAEGLAEGMGQVASRKDRHRLPNRCLPFSCYPIGFSRTS